LLVGLIQSHGVAALAEPGQRGPGRMRQPTSRGDKLFERRPVAAFQQRDDLRNLGSAARSGIGRFGTYDSFVDGGGLCVPLVVLHGRASAETIEIRSRR
jgi:hypothetical protein